MHDSKKSVLIYNVETLAGKAAVTRRTIHFYVQRGLLPRPDGGGRGHYYTEVHLDRLKQIQKWREQGLPLEKMKEFFSGASSWSNPAPAQHITSQETQVTLWTRIGVGADIEISFKRGALTQEDQEAIKKYVLSRVSKK